MRRRPDVDGQRLEQRVGLRVVHAFGADFLEQRGVTRLRERRGDNGYEEQREQR
ncbi:MAG: hypothetical protein QM736_01280 [Vicinamibacterales bacterium]